MRRYSPPYYSPPRRGYGGRGRSPPRRSYGGYGARREHSQVSLLVRNIPLNCRPEDLRIPFERFGRVRDVYLPRDFYSGEPRGFAFVEYVDAYDATEAQYHMNGQLFGGRRITVVVAAQNRKRPEEMRGRTRPRGPDYNGRRSNYGRSHSRSMSHSRSPPRLQNSRVRHRSRSYSPAPRRHGDASVTPDRRRTRSPRERSQGRNGDYDRRSYSPGRGDQDRTNNGYDVRAHSDAEDSGRPQRSRRSPGRASRSPSGSRSRSADISPARSS